MQKMNVLILGCVFIGLAYVIDTAYIADLTPAHFAQEITDSSRSDELDAKSSSLNLNVPDVVLSIGSLNPRRSIPLAVTAGAQRGGTPTCVRDAASNRYRPPPAAAFV